MIQPPPLDTRPSFRRIHSHLVERIARGEWRPGELMPGEVELAREYGVSVGTLRKALDAMQTQAVIERRRGRGTTVRRSTIEHTLFNYYRFRDADTNKLEAPTDRILSHASHPANANERNALQLAGPATVYRIRRVRSVRGVPFLVDQMSFPEGRFARFAWPVAGSAMNVYQYLEREFGAIVGTVQERLRVTRLSATEATALARAADTPALEVSRLAFDLAGGALELRRSVVLTEQCVYLSELRRTALHP